MTKYLCTGGGNDKKLYKKAGKSLFTLYINKILKNVDKLCGRAYLYHTLKHSVSYRKDIMTGHKTTVGLQRAAGS